VNKKSKIICFSLCLFVIGCASSKQESNRYEPVPVSESKTNVSSSSPEANADSPEPPVNKLPELSQIIPTDTAQEPVSTSEVSGQTSKITIQPDCILQVSVEEDPNLDGSYPVNKIGAIELGYVGPIILYNKTEKEAEAKIASILKSRYFKKATVKVKILRASYDRIKVDGSVNQPGLIPIGAGDVITLNDALLRAGGIRASAKGARVRIVRGGLLSALASTLEGEEYSLVSEDGKPNIPYVTLSNNDVAYVFSSEVAAESGGEKDILVLGEVRRPGVYRFTSEEPCTIMHLLFKLGELPPYANSKAVRIVRRDQNGVENEIVVDARKIISRGDPQDDVKLENGDRVIVPARRISLF